MKAPRRLVGQLRPCTQNVPGLRVGANRRTRAAWLGRAAGIVAVLALVALSPAVPVAADASLPAGVQVPGALASYNISSLTFGAYSNILGVRMIPVTFTVASGSGVQNVLLAYGAHLASEEDWGTGNGASLFPGAS